MHSLEAAHRLASALTALRPAAARVEVHPLTPDGRSWLLHAPVWWPSGDEMTGLWDARPSEATIGMIMGRPVEFPRRTRAYGVDYKYTGQTQRSFPMNDAPTFVRNVCSALKAVPTLEVHNALLLNWYDARNKEYMGAHSDDERELIAQQPIVSMSWCTPGHFRRFRFTAKKGVDDALLPTFAAGFAPGVLQLRDGCLVVMGGLCQTTHKHEVMKPTKALGESEGYRINLTLRAFRAAPALESRKRQRDEHKVQQQQGQQQQGQQQQGQQQQGQQQEQEQTARLGAGGGAARGALLQPSIADAFKSAAPPAPADVAKRVHVEGEEAQQTLRQLVEMGFEAAAASDALRRGGGSVEGALRVLFGSGEQ